jgi:PilZ domain
MLDKYFDKIVKGTEVEDSLVINQAFKGMIGQRFSILSYYKEIPVSYDAKLLSVENEMAEFEVHDYQAKVISMQRKALIYANPKNPFREDVFAEAFYVNIAKKRVVLCKFSYAKILSNMRRFVRVELGDMKADAVLMINGEIICGGAIKDISLGGAALSINTSNNLLVGTEFNLFLKLPNPMNKFITEVSLTAVIISVAGTAPNYNCIIEFHPDKSSQQQIAYFINQRQVEIIKELKDLIV